MNSNDILAVLDQIAATPSKNEKEALVKQHIADEGFCKALEYAYNPFKTYGIRQIPTRENDGDCAVFDSDAWGLLDALAARNLTGAAARDAIKDELDALSDESADLLVRIIRKDLRAGFSASTINKAKKGTIPDFPYMRCSLPKDAKLNTWDWTLGVFGQEKADGSFANVDVEEGGLVRVTTRQGSPYPLEALGSIVGEMATRLKSETQTHGEFLVRRDGVILDRATGNGILNSLQQGGGLADNEELVFKIWDQIPLSAVKSKGKYEVPYVRRLNALVSQLRANAGNQIGLIETKIFHSIEECYAYAASLMKRGKEGAVIKNPHAIWRDATSKEQVKIKLEFEVDLVVTGVVNGRDGTKNEGRPGSLTCESSDGLVVVDVTVKNEAMRDKVEADPDDWIGRIIPVTANDLLLPSASNEFHSLFLPRMSEASYRTDKTVADDLERIKDQKQAAIFGQKLKEAA